ncbi:hypothetical protein NE237_025605 [Protea cynaroides]|uniref:Uncharacterized protein n=1 Tax=Protea cynaroides TaxID=273540 RepID=A0A9Q0H7D5_9MAGN|nr:hypothetical protein NE237_025605 [Protea cynaroides]
MEHCRTRSHNVNPHHEGNRVKEKVEENLSDGWSHEVPLHEPLKVIPEDDHLHEFVTRAKFDVIAQRMEILTDSYKDSSPRILRQSRERSCPLTRAKCSGRRRSPQQCPTWTLSASRMPKSLGPGRSLYWKKQLSAGLERPRFLCRINSSTTMASGSRIDLITHSAQIPISERLGHPVQPELDLIHETPRLSHRAPNNPDSTST